MPVKFQPYPKPTQKPKQRKGFSVKTALRAMSKSPSAKLCKIADHLWAKVVKLEARGICQVTGCGRPATESHHVWTRSIRHLRHSTENGCALCFLHHVGALQSAHKDPEWFQGVLMGLMGLERYKALQRYAHMTFKPDYGQRIIELKQLLKELGE